MKINNLKLAFAAALMTISGSAFAQPTASAPAPTAAQEDVISIFCNSYTPQTEWSFGEWGSGTQWTNEKIGDSDDVAKFVTGGAGYFGWQFADKNLSDYDTVHLDIWAENDCTVNFWVISISESNATQDKINTTLTLKANQWNVFNLPLSLWSENNLARVFQFKFADMPNQTIYVDNVYFEKVAVADTEAPTWASDPVASPRSTSVAISATANDDLTKALTYEVSATADFATIAATAKGIPGSAVELDVNGLTAGTEYTYYVRVKDAAGNVSEVKTVTFTTTEGAAVVATYYGVFYPTDWEEKASVAGKDVAPKLLWQAETLEGYGDVVVKAKLGEALPDGAALKFCAYIENGVGSVDNKDMTKVGDTEYTIQLSDVLPAGTVLTKDQIFGQFFFRIYPKEGGVSRTKILAAQYKVGASNDPIAEDVTAPVWNADPTTQNVTDKAVEIVVNLTDDSGNAVVTISGDNGFAETAKTVVANGNNQVISLNGLTAETTYNLTLAVKDGTGNVGESKNVSFTTAETPHLDVLYQTVDFVSGDWTKHGDANTFAPDGSIQIAVNADNTITMKVAPDAGADLVDNAQCILHGIDTFWLTLQDDGTFVGTSTNSITNRDASQPFHLNFVLKEGKGNSEFKVTYFTPSAGSTSAVADVVADDVTVVAADGVIRVEGSQFAVYTLAGQQVYNGVGEARLDRGVYVVVVDGKAVKVML